MQALQDYQSSTVIPSPPSLSSRQAPFQPQGHYQHRVDPRPNSERRHEEEEEDGEENGGEEQDEEGGDQNEESGEQTVEGDEALLDLEQLEELHHEAERMKALGNKHMAAQVKSKSENGR